MEVTEALTALISETIPGNNRYDARSGKSCRHVSFAIVIIPLPRSSTELMKTALELATLFIPSTSMYNTAM